MTNKRQKRNDLKNKDSNCPYCSKEISHSQLLTFGACANCLKEWSLAIDFRS